MNLTTKDAAKLLEVSERTIYRWIDQGTIPVYKINGQCRFNRAELLEWATSRRMSLSVDILKEPESVEIPSLLEAIRAGGIVYRVSGADKPSVLRSVVEVMRLPEEVDREFLYQVLLARENLGSTGIGEGIAIPHVRNPIVLHVQRPSITVCFLDNPIDFDAIDGQPVHTLFTLISPTVRAHLKMLSMLMFALRDPEFKAAIERQDSRDEILAQAERVEKKLATTTDNPQGPAGRESA